MPDISDDDLESDAFELSLEEMLERVSAATRADWEAREGTQTPPANRAPRPPLPPRAPVETVAPTATPGSARAHRVAWPLLALSAVGLGVMWVDHRHGASDAPPISYENLPEPAAGRPGSAAAAARKPIERAPPLQVAVDADASTESLMVDQLNGLGGAASQAAPTFASAPAFAIARYDTLQAPSSDWRVVAPLNVEEVYALVPVTSRLRDLGDLRGRRINVGAPASARAISGAALYHTLFGAPLPATSLGSASKETALRALLDGQGLDAMLLFDGQPSAWLESLPMEMHLRLKVLPLQPGSPASRKALQAYLPATVAPTLANNRAAVPTLGELTFLVASLQAARPQQALRALCEQLPSLRARGHPKWNEVDPSLRLPLNVQRASGLDPALQACRLSPPVNSTVVSLSGARP